MPRVSTDPIVDTMIALSRCPLDQRVLFAGATDPGRIKRWRDRGYRRVATTATCSLPDGGYGVAAVEWRHGSIRALAATLDWLVHFLSATGVVVIWTDAATATASGRRELATALERYGLTIETWTRCGGGFVVSARRVAPQADGVCEPLRHTIARSRRDGAAVPGQRGGGARGYHRTPCFPAERIRAGAADAVR